MPEPKLTHGECRRIAEIEFDYEMGDVDVEDMTRWIDEIWNEARARVGLPAKFTLDEHDA